MKTLITLILMLISISAFAVDLPIYSENQKTMVFESKAVTESVDRFRVLVFPHVGTYSVPQGREAIVSSVRVTSRTVCDSYAASLDAQQEWIKSGPLLKQASVIDLNVSQLGRAGVPAPIYYECKSPFVVNRPAPLKSIEYSGDFVATTDGNKVQIINLIDSDTYIKGVVPAEVEATWPIEVLKAQAIAARTYAWWSVLQSRGQNAIFDMDDTVSYQAYLGNSKRSAITDSVTDETQGLVMKADDQIVKAYFSADSGGFTEDSLSAFGAELSYCQAKPEAYDLTQFPSTWTKSYTLALFQAQMAGAHFIPAGISVRNVYVEPADLNRSGRVMRLSVLGSNGKVYSVSGNDFRYLTKIRSNLFEVKFSSSGVVINGKGYGHGVGMAQIGALQYAKQFNWNFDQILQFYYTGVTITNE